MKSPCFVGLDLGTSGCRALARDEAGKILAREALPLPTGRRTENGASEQEPVTWWQAVTGVLKRLVDRLERHRPLALAVAGTSSTLLLADEAGTPLTPALMYDDRRATEEAASLAGLAPAEAPVHTPTSSLAKLLWLLRHHSFTGKVHALHQAEWIAGRLCGHFDTGDENNCLKLGYDPVARRWPEWMEALDLPADLLPRVVPPGTVLGVLQPEIATGTGLPPECLVVAGTTDSTAATLAAGLERPGDALTSLGSTLVTKVLSPRPLFHADNGVYSHRIFGHWLAGGASNSGGRVLLQFFEPEELTALSERITPRRPLCLDYYPLPAPGERFPVNDPGLQPRIHPVPRDRARFLQALLEGMARIEALAYRRLHELGAPRPLRVLTSGGGAGNRAWTEIRERILGVPVEAAPRTETAWGAAAIAARGWREGGR